MKLWTYIKDEALKNPSQTIQEDNSEITFEETVIFAEQFAKKIRGGKMLRRALRFGNSRGYRHSDMRCGGSHGDTAAV